MLSTAAPVAVNAWHASPDHRTVLARALALIGDPDRAALAALAGHPVWASWRGRSGGATFLHLGIARTSQADVLVPFLVGEGLAVDTPTRRGHSPLHTVFQGMPPAHRWPWFLALTQAGACWRAPCADGQSLVGLAMQAGEVVCLERLLADGLQPTVQDRAGVWRCNHPAALALFWRTFGAPTTQEERTALFLRAAAAGHWGFVEAILPLGVDLTSTLEGGNALMMACVCARSNKRQAKGTAAALAAIERLVAAGMDPHATGQPTDEGPALSAWELIEKHARQPAWAHQAVARGRQARLAHTLVLPQPPPGARARL